LGLLSQTEVLRLKLSTIPAPLLKDLGRKVGVVGNGAGNLIKNIIVSNIDEQELDAFIKQEYAKKAKERQSVIPDADLLGELNRVRHFKWGIEQGQLDNKIQVQFVRQYPRYDDLVSNVEKTLYESVKDYVICSWYNFWSTVIIEDIISTHPRVVPTLKNIKGVDLFFDGQPFDLKITYMPKGYSSPEEASESPRKLAVWLYENQGAQRFGADNRLFVVLHDTENADESWRIKRDIDFVKQNINKFLESQSVSKEDEIVFTFQKRTYTTITKILLVAK
jgi:hypothetical protein